MNNLWIFTKPAFRNGPQVNNYDLYQVMCGYSG